MRCRLLTGLLFLTVPAPLLAGEGTFISNGEKLFYKDVGTGQPVVLVHGYLANHDNQWFKPKVADALVANGFRVIALDSRGHGQSAKPLGEDKYGAEMAEDVVRLLKHLNIKKAHLVGYSMGSWISQKVAADHPELIQTLTVGGAGLLRKREKESVNGLAGTLNDLAADKPGAESALKLFTNGKLDIPTKPDEAKALRDAGLAVGKLELDDAKAKAYPGPVLGLVGEKDLLFKPSMTALKELRTGMNMPPFIPKATHLTAYVDPLFAKELVKFLKANPITP